MLIKYHFDYGKYKVVRDDVTYATTLYRNGEYWEAGTKDVIGDKLFHAMLNEIDNLKDYKTWYDEALTASNEIGFACMTAADVIRFQEEEINRLREYEFMYKELQE